MPGCFTKWLYSGVVRSGQLFGDSVEDEANAAARGRRYDVIFDTAIATTFGRCRSSLEPTGRYLTLHTSLGLLLLAAFRPSSVARA